MASISDFGEREPSERYGSFPSPRRSMELSVEVSKAKAAFMHGGRPLNRLLLNTNHEVFEGRVYVAMFLREDSEVDGRFVYHFARPIGSSAYPFACCDPTCTKPRSGLHPRFLSQKRRSTVLFARDFPLSRMLLVRVVGRTTSSCICRGRCGISDMWKGFSSFNLKAV